PPSNKNALVALFDDLEHWRFGHRVVTTTIELHVQEHRRNRKIFGSDLFPLALDVTRKIAMSILEPGTLGPRLLVVDLREHHHVHPRRWPSENASLEVPVEKVHVLATTRQVLLRPWKEPVHRLTLPVLVHKRRHILIRRIKMEVVIIRDRV